MKEATRHTGLATALILCITRMASAQADLESPLDALLNTRISTAAKFEQSVGEAPASVTIISSEEIERAGFETLADVLRTVRGVYTTYDRSYEYVGVRGFSRPTDYNTRVLILIDGHEMNEGVFGFASIGTDLPVDLRHVERIEFVRGPGSVLYGSGAMFGVINIITKTALAMEGVNGSLSAGSFGKRTGTARVGHTFADGTALTVSSLTRSRDGDDLYFPEFDSIENMNGVARSLDGDVSHGVLATLKRGNLTALAHFGSRDKTLPTASFGSKFGLESGTEDRHMLIDLGYARKFGAAHTLNIRAGWHKYQYYGTYANDPAFLDAEVNVKQSLEARWVWDVRSNSRLVAGTQAMHHSRAEYRYLIDDSLYFDAPFRIFSTYVQHEISFVRSLALTTGLRYDHYSDSHDSTYGSVTPRVALVYTPSSTTALKALYGRAFRAPAPYERYYEGESQGVARSVNLEPESVTTAEMSVEQRIGANLLASASVFAFTASKLIDQHTVEETGFLQFQNGESTRARGVEVEMNYRNPRGLWAYLSYVRQRATEKDAWISNSPQELLKAGISTPRSLPLQMALEFQHDGARLSARGLQIDGFTLTNLNVSRALGSRARLGLKVQNLFDVAYATPGGFEHVQNSIPQDSRQFLVTISVGAGQ